MTRNQQEGEHIAYTVYHPLVVDVPCVLFWIQSGCMITKQNTRDIYHKWMINGVVFLVLEASLTNGYNKKELRFTLIRHLFGLVEVACRGGGSGGAIDGEPFPLPPEGVRCRHRS